MRIRSTRRRASPERGALYLVLLAVLVAAAAPASGAPIGRLYAQLLPDVGGRMVVPPNPALAMPLAELASVAATQGPGAAAQYAQSRGIRLINGQAQVTVVFKTAGDAATTNLAALGATPVHTLGPEVEALVAPVQLPTIAALAQVAMVRQPAYYYPAQGTVISEGVDLIDPGGTFAAAGLDGTATDVVVIDVGFRGYKTLLGTELPATVDARSFRADGDIDSALATEHGTACAEIIHDLAPAAALHLWAIDTSLAVAAAINQAILDGTHHVANMSIGSTVGPFDGTGPDATVVDALAAADVLPSVAAGNAGQSHWAGVFVDTNANNFNEFALGDESIGIPGAQVILEAYLSWWQTPGIIGGVTDQDYDLVLLDPTVTDDPATPQNEQEIARSGMVQNGDDPPWDVLVALLPDPAVTYELQILEVSAIGNGVFHLFSMPWQTIEAAQQVRAGSLSNPADAVGAFTVGATRGVGGLPDGLLVDDQELFSSEGPTDDARTKPDLAAPDYVSTVSYGPLPMGGFPGTSASAPHVAGAAALLKHEDPTRTAAQLAARLEALALANFDLGVPGKDDKFGSGRCFLRLRGPRIVITSPRPGQIINFPTPTIVGSIRPADSPIDLLTIALRIDGVLTPGWTYDPLTFAFRYPIPAPGLSNGRHTVTLTASDTDGDPGNIASVTFRIALPIASEGTSMVSFPVTAMTDTDPVNVFGLPLGSFQLARWLPQDTAGNKYHVYPDPFASFEPPDAAGLNATVSSPPAGLGYFLNVPSDTVIALNGTPVPTGAPYEMRLWRGTTPPLGWNMLGSPLNVSLPLIAAEFEADGTTMSLVEAISAGHTNGILFTWVAESGGGGYYTFSGATDGVLQPNKAYWLHVTHDLVMRVFPSGAAAAPVAAAAELPGTPKWRVRLSAEAGTQRDPMNFAGVGVAASTGKDAGDIPEPPPLSAGVKLCFPHTDWGPEASGEYVQDLLPADATKWEWEFEVTTQEPNQPVTLRWDLSGAPRDVQFRLTDLDGGDAVAMRTQTQYTFNSGLAGQSRRFQVVAGRSLGQALTITGVAVVPGRAVGTQEINFDLSVPASVTVEVRNLAGVLIKRVTQQQALADGRATIVWDGRNRGGVRTPPGTYLCRIQARTEAREQASAIARVLVIR